MMPYILSLHFKIPKNGPEKTHLIVWLSSATFINAWYFTTLTRVIAQNSTSHLGDLKLVFPLIKSQVPEKWHFKATKNSQPSLRLNGCLCALETGKGDIDMNDFFGGGRS